MNADRGEAVAAELGGVFALVDVADPQSVRAGFAKSRAVIGQERVLMNCAGIGPVAKTISKGVAHDPGLFLKAITVNLAGSFNCASQAAEGMVAADPLTASGERGVIISTASVAAFEGQIGQVAYTAAKAGIAGMMLTMARDLGSLGIRCMAIAPSLFSTGLTEGIPAEYEASLTRDAAFPKRMGRPEEYARLAVGIVENPMLNGSTIRLDAGQRFAPKM